MKFYTNVQMVGDQFLVRGYENNENFMIREKYSPTLFVPSKGKSDYKTLYGEYVEPIQPGSVRECREFIKKYENVEGFKIYGNTNYIYQYISDNYPEEEIKFDISKINLATLDIEVAAENGFPDVESAAEEILLITLQDYTNKNVITWGRGKYTAKKSNVTYKEFQDEESLLNDFIYWWMDNTPEIVTGWNIKFYDIPYIVRRLDRILGEKMMKRMSPWGLVTEREKIINGRKNINYDIGGISQLDYLELYKKFTYKAQESYRLDHIAFVELGQKKLDHSEFDTFKDFYTKGWEKFIDYNLIDVELVDKLEDKMKLIELAITMAYDAKVNFEDVFSQVRMWDVIIFNYLKKKNIAIPFKVESSKEEKFIGAYVKEPIPGLYDWVLSLDLTSLYPSLIMQYNLSPETFLGERYPGVTLDKLINKELSIENIDNKCVSANGFLYDKNKKGVFPQLVEKIFNERQLYKKQMLKEQAKLQEIEAELKKRGIDLNTL
jgi:DNA polymerase elongation subunit (family B)